MIIALLLYIIIFIGLFAYIRDAIFLRVPFVSTGNKAVGEIIDALKLDDNSTLFDLGCGNAHLLRKIRKINNKASLVGVEWGIIPFFVSKILSKGKNIDIRFGNMFKADVSHATHIYLYTGDFAMEKFEDKLFRECRKGTRIVSMDFIFKNKKEVEHIPLPKTKYSLCRDIYVYEV